MGTLHEINPVNSDFHIRGFKVRSLDWPPHWHDEIEIVYVLSGKLEMYLGKKRYILNEKDIMLINSGDIHHYTKCENEMIIVQFGLSMLDTMFIPIFANRRFLDPHIRYENQNTKKYSDIIVKHIMEIVDEYDKKLPGYETILKARIYDLQVHLVRNLPTEDFTDQEIKTKCNRQQRLEKVIQFVEDNYTENITINEAAGIANYSVYHFARFFKETTGMTFEQYLRMYRLRKAEEFLFVTDDLITEIAYKVGFNSVKTFNRNFKEKYGCTPSIYRKSNTNYVR